MPSGVIISHGLFGKQRLDILRAIDKSEEPYISSVGDDLDRSPYSTSKLITEMTEAGLVEKKPKIEDSSRKVKVSVTPAAQKILEAVEEMENE